MGRRLEMGMPLWHPVGPSVLGDTLNQYPATTATQQGPDICTNMHRPTGPQLLGDGGQLSQAGALAET